MVSLLTVKLARDIRRQRLQFAGIALTLALGVAVFGAAFDSYDNLETSYAETYERLRFADATVTGGDTEAIAAAARRTEGVAGATTRLQADVPFRLGGGDRDGDGGGDAGGERRTLLGRIVGQPAGTRTGAPVNRILVEQGAGLDPAVPEGVVVERHMADHFDLQIGDTVEVFAGAWRPLPVAGIAVSPEYLWPARDRQDLLTSPDDFGVLFVADSLVAELAPETASHQALIRYRAGADRPSVDRAVRALATEHGAGDVMVRAAHPSYAALQEDVQGFGELAVLFPLLFLVAGGLATYVLLGRLVRAQRSEIGMLAANGYPARRLLAHYVAFGAAAGATGSLLGAAGGLGLAHWLTRSYTSALGIPLALVRFHPLTPLIGLAIGTAAGILAAVGPARAATRVPPAEAMRGVAPAGVTRRGLLERVPGVRGLPIRARLALRNVRRSPRRAVSTGAGITIAAVLVLSSLGMLDTVSLIIDDQFHHIQRQDAQLYLAGPPGPELRATVGGLPGVAATEPALDVPVVLAAGAHRYQTTLTGFEPGTTMHHFADPLPRDGLLLEESLGSTLGVDAGQTVDVTVGDTDPVPVTVAGFVGEPLGSVAYATRATAERLAGGQGLPSLLVRYTGDVTPDTMRQRLADQPGVVALRDIRGSEQAARQLLELFYAIVGFMLLFGTILAFVVLFNTLSVNLAERTVELATLRADGARLATLARMVSGENLLLVVAAIPIGLAAGWLTGWWLIRSLSNDLFHFSLRLRPGTPLLLATALVAITLLTHLPARRNLRRLDIARIVRDRAL